MSLAFRSFLSFLLLLGLVLGWPALAASTVYYVSGAGNAGNDCSAATSSNPTSARNTITRGLQCLASGDTLVVHGGTYIALGENCLSDTSVGNNFSGTPSQPTTIQASSIGSVLLQDTGPECGTGSFLYIERTAYLVIDGFRLTGLTQGPPGPAGVTTDETGIGSGGEAQAHHVTWQNIEMRHMRTGLNLGSTGGFWTFLNMQVLLTGMIGPGEENPTAYCNLPESDTGCHGGYVHTGGPGMVFDNFTVDSCSGFGIQFSSPSGLGPAPGAIVRNSSFSNCERGLYVRAGASVFNSVFHHNRFGMVFPDAGTLRHNTFYWNGFSGGEQLILDGNHHTIQNNIFLDPQGDFVACRDGNNNPVSCNFTVGGNLCNGTAGTQGICTHTGTAAATFASVTEGSADFLRLKSGSPALDIGVSTGIPTDKTGASRSTPAQHWRL